MAISLNFLAIFQLRRSTTATWLLHVVNKCECTFCSEELKNEGGNEGLGVIRSHALLDIDMNSFTHKHARFMQLARSFIGKRINYLIMERHRMLPALFLLPYLKIQLMIVKLLRLETREKFEIIHLAKSTILSPTSVRLPPRT